MLLAFWTLCVDNPLLSADVHTVNILGLYPLVTTLEKSPNLPEAKQAPPKATDLYLLTWKNLRIGED